MLVYTDAFRLPWLKRYFGILFKQDLYPSTELQKNRTLDLYKKQTLNEN